MNRPMTQGEKELCEKAQEVYGDCWSCGLRQRIEHEDGRVSMWCGAGFVFPLLREEQDVLVCLPD